MHGRVWLTEAELVVVDEPAGRRRHARLVQLAKEDNLALPHHRKRRWLREAARDGSVLDKKGTGCWDTGKQPACSLRSNPGDVVGEDLTSL